MTVASRQRKLNTIKLQKPQVGGLGFSVVGLKSENRGELGIFVQDLQPNGVAERYLCVLILIHCFQSELVISIVSWSYSTPIKNATSF